jgi:hypothetical protein
MFNYATVVGTIATSSMGNLYVPGRKNSFGASTERIAISLATDPIGNAITEFVPDLARRINFQVVIVQRVINRVAIAEGGRPLHLSSKEPLCLHRKGYSKALQSRSNQWFAIRLSFRAVQRDSFRFARRSS